MGEEAAGYRQSQQVLNEAHCQQARTKGPFECGILELTTAEHRRAVPFPSVVLVSEPSDAEREGWVELEEGATT